MFRFRQSPSGLLLERPAFHGSAAQLLLLVLLGMIAFGSYLVFQYLDDGGPDSHALGYFETSLFTLMFVGMWYLLTQRAEFVSAIELQRGQIGVTDSGRFLFFESRRPVPFDAATPVCVQIGPERKWRKIELELEVGHGPRRFQVDLQVEDVDRRGEALDVAFRVAEALGRPAYRFSRSDPRGMTVELHAEMGPETKPVPSRFSDSDYREDAVGTLLPRQELLAPPFDPKRYQGPFKVPEWDPGRRVHTHLPLPADAGWRLVLRDIGIRIGLGFLVSASVGGLVAFVVGRQIAAAVVALGVVVAVIRVIRGRSRVTDALFDWATQTARFTLGERVRAVPFDQIRRVELRGLNKTASETRQVLPGSTETAETTFWTEYSTELWAFTSAGRHLIAATRTSRGSSAPYEELLPMANDLAKALNVPLSWREYSDGGKG